jgi:hypothetical protein
VPGIYGQTSVNNSGIINGISLAAAGQVAWLLDNYGVGGQDGSAGALQAAIWNVIYGDRYQLDTAASYSGQYSTMLAALGTNTGNIGNYLIDHPVD